MEDQFLQRLPLVYPINPPTRELQECSEITLAAERLRLESADLAGGSGLLLRLAGSASHDVPHRGIAAKPLGIVDTFLSGQVTVVRLSQQGHQAVVLVAAEARILQAICAHRSQAERLVAVMAMTFGSALAANLISPFQPKLGSGV